MLMNDWGEFGLCVTLYLYPSEIESHKRLLKVPKHSNKQETHKGTCLSYVILFIKISIGSNHFLFLSLSLIPVDKIYFN